MKGYMADPLRVLLVEDIEADASLMIRELEASGLPVHALVVNDRVGYLTHLSPEIDVVLCDYNLPAFSQPEALSLLKKRGWDIPFIVISNAYSEGRSIKAIQDGAFDWILKEGFDLLAPTILQALQQKQQRQKQRQAEHFNASFSLLGQRLSLARTPQDAAEILAKVSDKLFGWDAFSFNAYCHITDLLESLLDVDTIAGKRVPVFPEAPLVRPTNRQRKALADGGLLILREHPYVMPEDAVPFGNVERASASIVCVPVRNGETPVGFLSIQSYKPHTYTQETVRTLQAMADFCGGALERLRTEETLRKSEERYRSLVAATSQMVWTTAADGQVIEDSATWRGYTGQTWESYKGWGWLLALHPNEIDRTLELWNKAIATKSILQTEFRVRSADGNYRHFAVRGAPVFDLGGNIREWVATCTDITEQKRAELRNRTFLELAQKLNFSRTPEEAARNILDEAEKLFGWDSGYVSLYSRENSQMRKLIAVDTINGTKTPIPLHSPSKPTSTAARILTHGAELVLRHSSQEKIETVLFGSNLPSASLMFVPMRNGSEVVGLLSLQSYTKNAYDTEDLNTFQALADFCGGVLERLRIEEAHHESEERFRTLVEQAADAMFLFDERGSIVDINQRACRSLGYTHRELIGLDISNVDKNFAELRETEDWRLILAGEPVSFTSTHLRKDGGQFPVEIRAGLLQFRDQKLFLALARDITERMQLEEQLRQSQKMEAFGQLAGGVAHDFNNLLTVISGYSSLVLSNEGLDAETRESLQEIHAASEKATNLTRQLLTLSRRKELSAETLKVGEVVDGMSRILNRIIGEDIRLVTQYPSELPPIQGDIGMLEQVILNLAVNARDAMPRGGEISIRIELAEITSGYAQRNPEARIGEFLCMAVHDTGCGIAPENRKRIFEPFFTTKGRKGTGLGLATVYGIIKQHRGWIEVASDVGFGSTFKIFLPTMTTYKSPDSKSAPLTFPLRDGGSETILLVEDEGALRALARQILQRKGYRVLEAESGLKALDVWERHGDEIDLLLTDMVMPDGVNGRELAQRLLAQASDLKVIYTSGYSMALESFESELREGWNFLQKPYHPQKLTKAVRDMLDERSMTA
ncbi:MAG: PAS domain S-box protein [Limisphaerales bacterium]